MTKAKREIRERLVERDILCKMGELREQLFYARLQFNQATEPELVDACVYEISALQARYDFYLRRARELNTEAPYAVNPAAALR